ncbi:MAG: hypothetical protein AABW50_02665 [Nanoarchaeota archaeon]
MEKIQKFFCPSLFPKSRKAQAWGLDVIIASVIFLVGIIILYFYAINYASNSKGQLEELLYEGQLASELILSDDDFGILSENKVNQSRLDNFSTSYDYEKSVLGVTHDFYFNLDGSVYGRLNSTATEDFIRITRITVYNGKPAKFELYIYR